MTRTSKRTEGTMLVRDADGTVHNLCHLCDAPVRYPDGIYLRGGREVHVACYRARRDHFVGPFASHDAAEVA